MSSDATQIAYHCGRLTILPAARRVLRDGRTIELEAKVLDLIVLLLENRDRAVPKETVITEIWGARPVSDAALSQLLYKARRALDDNGNRQTVIRTVYSHGLQWVAPVKLAVEAEAGASAQAPPPTPDRQQVGAPAPRFRRGSGVLLAGGIGVAAIIIVISLWLIPRANAPPPPAPPRLAVLPLQDDTGSSGDGGLAWTVRGVPALIDALVDHGGDLDVIDAATVARAWGFIVPEGRSHAAHLRYVTGADILVTPHLRKLADKVYQLTMHIDTDGITASNDIVLTGADPAKLAVESIPRIRRALHLDRIATPTLKATPHDTYMAETYGRGMAAATHGNWKAAKPYFTLVVKNAPDFLDGRLRLGEAQAHTDQLADAETTLRTLLQVATQRGAKRIVGTTQLQLGNLQMLRHQYQGALETLAQARASAEQTGDAGLQVSIALKAVAAQAHLHQDRAADASLQRAGQLMQTHHLRQRNADLYNGKQALAAARGDASAAERAGRAALAASEAIGNQSDALIDTYNLALALMHQQRSMQALVLFANAYQRAQKLGFNQLIFGAGDNLAIGLLSAGFPERAQAIAQRLRALAERQKNPTWQALALMIRGGAQWYAGNPAAALRTCREADLLVSSGDPALRINLWLELAPAALLVEPASLADLAQRADDLVAAQPSAAAFMYEQQLIHALAFAAVGNDAAATQALRRAALKPPIYDAGLDNLRSAGLLIALHTGNTAAATIALHGFDPDTANQTDVLRLAAAWAVRSDNASLRDKADARRAQLKQSAMKALADARIELPVPARSITTAVTATTDSLHSSTR